MTPPAQQVRLKDVIDVVRQLQSAPFRITQDWVFRHDDPTGAWSEGRDRGRLRAAFLTPLSLAEHGLNRLLGRAGALALKPILSSHLRALEGTEEATAYGLDLARAVAAKLSNTLRPGRDGVPSATLAYVHRDYCGMGLECRETEGRVLFHYGIVRDGELATPYMMTFPSAEDLAHWLAAQSDLTLSGAVGEPPLLDWRMAGNQRLTRARLVHFVT